MNVKAAAVLAGAALFLAPGPAYAERSRDSKECESEGERAKGNCNRGRDCRGSDDCSSFSPSFENSPVVICLPESSCRFESGPAEGEEPS